MKEQVLFVKHISTVRNLTLDINGNMAYLQWVSPIFLSNFVSEDIEYHITTVIDSIIGTSTSIVTDSTEYELYNIKYCTLYSFTAVAVDSVYLYASEGQSLIVYTAIQCEY